MKNHKIKANDINELAQPKENISSNMGTSSVVVGTKSLNHILEYAIKLSQPKISNQIDQSDSSKSIRKPLYELQEGIRRLSTPKRNHERSYSNSSKKASPQEIIKIINRLSRSHSKK